MIASVILITNIFDARKTRIEAREELCRLESISMCYIESLWSFNEDFQILTRSKLILFLVFVFQWFVKLFV